MDKNQNINDISGIQLFTLMNLLNDFEKTIKKIRDTGFKILSFLVPILLVQMKPKRSGTNIKKCLVLKRTIFMMV